MDIGSVNWLAVIVAGVSSFVIGGVWYGPLFGKAWMRENGLSEEALARRKTALVFGLSFVLSLVAAANLEIFLGAEATAGFGAVAGFLAGLGWVAALTGIQYLFEMRSLKLFFMNAGYSVVTLTVMGVILGAW
jgi:hypothetical protein